MMQSNKCNHCNTVYAHRQSLWRHKKSCGTRVGRKRSARAMDSTDIPIFDGAEFGTGKPISKETFTRMEKLYAPQRTVNNIINGTTSSPSKMRKLNRVSDNSEDIGGVVFDRPINLDLDNVKSIDIDGKPIPLGKDLELENVGRILIDNVSSVDIGGNDTAKKKNANFVEYRSRTDNQKSKLSRKKNIQRMKDDIVGYSDSSGSGSDTESEEEEIGVSKVKFLPSSREGLEKRVNKLFVEFRRNKKYENRNEIVFLLDELKRRDLISPKDYTTMNNLLAENLPGMADENILHSGEDEDDSECGSDSGDDDDGDNDGVDAVSRTGEGCEIQGGTKEEDVKAVAKSVVSDLIQDGIDNVNGLIIRFKREAGNEYVDIIDELDELVRCLFESNLLDGEPVMLKIKEQISRLESSSIKLSNLQKMKNILNGIRTTRDRVFKPLIRLHNAHVDRTDTQDVLKGLAREDLISDDQFLQLQELKDGFDLQAVVNIIKNSKTGHGIVLD